MSARSRVDPWWGPRVPRHPLIHLTHHQAFEYAGEALETLKAIDRGEMPMFQAVPLEYCGWPVYVAANGWRFCVFDDCDEFDYVEWAESPDGIRFDWHPAKNMPDRYEDNYYPKDWPFWLVFYWTPEHEGRWGYDDPERFNR